MAARSEHAAQPRPVRARASSSSVGTTRGAAAVAAAPAPGLEGGWAGWKEWLGLGTGTRPAPGVRMASYAIVLGIAAVLVVPFLPIQPVDDRGEPVPLRFTGLYLEARSLMSGETVDSHNTSAIDASGPVVLLQFVLPLVVLVGVIVAFRRSGRSTPLTVGMIALAFMVLLLQMTFFLPSMIFVAIASFQVRRVEMAGRVAEQAESKARAKDEPANEDEPADDYDDLDEEYDEELVDDEEYDEELMDGDEDELEDDDVQDAYEEEYDEELADADDEDQPEDDNVQDAYDDEDGVADEETVADDEAPGDETRPRSGRRRR